MSGVSNKWVNKTQNVSSDVKTNQFLNSSRFILYAAPYTAAGTIGTFNAVGVIQGVSWGEQKQVERIYELGSEVPYMIPGLTSGQLSISRILLNGHDLTNTLYGTASGAADAEYIKTLRDINTPINIMLASYADGATSTSGTAAEPGGEIAYSRIFEGCMITSRNESISAGQTVTAENCTLVYKQISDYIPLTVKGGS